MYTLFKELYQEYCGNPQYNVSILGVQKTGKTQILKALKDPEGSYAVGLKQEYKPTVGLNTTTFVFEQIHLLVWDLGGKQSIRKIWQSYYPYTHGFIYLFDHRQQEGLSCLKNILNNSEMTEVPCLILIRNSQIKNNIENMLREVEGESVCAGRQYRIELMPHSREKLYQQLGWLYDEMRKLDSKIRK